MFWPPTPRRASAAHFLDRRAAADTMTSTHSSRCVNNNPVAPSAPSAEPSSVPPRRRPSMALGSLWPKFLTLPTSRGHMDLVRKMLIGDQMRLQVISCLLYPLPLIYLELF